MRGLDFEEALGVGEAGARWLELRKFIYYFSVKGKEGGLFSVDFDFVPGAWAISHEAALKQGFRYLADFLDRELGRIGVFKKTPTFSDSSWETSAGYDYDGQLRLNPIKIPNPIRAVLLIPWIVVDPLLPKSWQYWSLFQTVSVSAKLWGEFTKTTGQAKLHLKFQLTHERNIGLLEQVLALPQVEVSEAARREVERLYHLLETHRRHPSRLLEVWEKGD
ncbi:MAG: hypothetical protein N3A55_10785 [Methylohalobius sp.]|nr:hypothetical protein [Methylohalobius sp.]